MHSVNIADHLMKKLQRVHENVKEEIQTILEIDLPEEKTNKKYDKKK